MNELKFLEYLEDNLINRCKELIFEYYSSSITDEELTDRLMIIFEDSEEYLNQNFKDNTVFKNMVISTEFNATDVATNFESAYGTLKPLSRNELMNILKKNGFKVLALREEYIVTKDDEGSLFYMPTKTSLRKDFVEERLKKLKTNKAKNTPIYQ